MGSKKDIRKIKKEHKQLEKERKSEYYAEFKEKGSHTIYLINEVINNALESNDFTSKGKDIHIAKQASRQKGESESDSDSDSESYKSVTSIDNADIYANLEHLYNLTLYLDLILDYRLYNSITVKNKGTKYTFTHLEKPRDVLGDVINLELKVKNDERKIKSILLSINDHMVITLK